MNPALAVELPLQHCPHKETVNEMSSNDSLLYSQTGAQHNPHQKGFIQQLMGADTKSHSQTVAEIGEEGLERLWESERSRTPQEKGPHSQPTRSHKGSQRQS